MKFAGRTAELALLDEELATIRRSGEGRLVLLRGRRQVGKSALVTEWLRRADVPAVYFQATQRSVDLELERFAEGLAASTLPELPQQVRTGLTFATWEAALQAVGRSATGPVALVVDELPYLLTADPSMEGTLQAVWDQHLQGRPVLLIVIGSDVAMMEALADHDRPLYGRINRVVRLGPLTVAEVAKLLSLDAAAAFDTYLVTGGFPRVVGSWERSLREFVGRSVPDPTHPLVFTGLRMMHAELPGELNPYNVLLAIGAGESAYSRIEQRSGVKGNTLTRALELLEGKRIVAAADPLSAQPKRITRYTVADPYLRFWLRFIGPRIDDIDRGRGDLVVESILRQWPDYRGAAVEPVVREAVERLLPDPRFADARRIGAYWTRRSDVQVDLVGTAGVKRPHRLEVVGSIKWRRRGVFSTQEARRLAEVAARVPGFDGRTLLAGISRTGFAADAGLDVHLGPEDLLET